MSNVLLGTAVGDALGVPFETKLVNYEPLVKWDGKTFLGSEHHKLQPGQYSDDTQMSLMVAESLINNNGFNPDDLAARYVDWIVSGRARGYGKTTLMAIENLQSGKHWSESGIAGSYGNGTAMRAAPFGVYFRNDLRSLINIVKIDSAITHASEEAEAGALAIALTAAYAVNNDLDKLLDKLHEQLPYSKVKSIIYSLDSLINSEYITPSQALRVLGTKANVIETVPSALYCFLKFDNYQDAVLAAIKAGGDTDTTAAIVGALFGAKDGIKAIDKSFHTVEDFDKLISLDSQLYNRSNGMFFPRAS
ncbi:MAG: ADP-ribosylglycohydrolase family protein [Candidatus Berkiella sp.]